jgi:hypothetical protein
MMRFFFILVFIKMSFVLFARPLGDTVPSTETDYAQRKLNETLQINSNSPFNKYKFKLAIDPKLFSKEAFGLTIKKNQINITGGDKNGLIYGVLGLIEDIKNNTKPSKLRNRIEKPHFPFRAIKFDLPWDTYRHSPALDLHVETCKDLKYWEKFLDMMAENRFNAITLWNLHPYTFMIKSKKYPEACPYSDTEMKEWKTLFTGIFKMAEERGIDTYIFPFNIFVSPEFSKAHNVMMDNLSHNHISNKLADTSQLVKDYTRTSVTQMFHEYPELDGMGITHGEAMGGLSPEEREAWLHETLVLGMGDVGRKLKLVHRIPLSANKNSGGSTSKEAEEITRRLIEEDAKLDFIEKPVWADLKYNWSHAHSTPKLIKVHGGKLYDTYFIPIPQDYKITWTARNEDFFCLRWGVPDFVRAHLAENTKAYAGGYFLGSETYIPAKDYFTKQSEGVSWTYAFERQWLFYKIWGRLLYNPNASDEIFQSEFTRRFGKDGNSLLEAHALSGKTPLMFASSYDFTWDFTLYSEGFMARNPKTANVDYISVDRQINQNTLDPNYISIKDFVAKNLQNLPFEKEQITPIIFADSLKSNALKALNLVKKIDVSKNKTLEYEVADIKVWAYLGLYYAEKTLGGVALQLYRKTSEARYKKEAIQYLENSLSYWDEVVKITTPLYHEMPLVHFSENKNLTKEELNRLRFHWKNLTKEVEKDIEIARNSGVEK